MTNFPFVENHESFKDLDRNNLCLCPRLGRMVREILAEIAMRDILHCDIDQTWVVIPAEKGDKEIATLSLLMLALLQTLIIYPMSYVHPADQSTRPSHGHSPASE